MGLGVFEKGRGVSALRFFYSQGAKITVTDLKTKEQLASQLKRLKNLKGVKYVLGHHDKKDFFKTDIVIKNPGVRDDSEFLKIAKKRDLPIYNDVSLFASLVDNPIIGITGTRGKTTTTMLAFELLKSKYRDVRVGGNMKISPLSFIDQLKVDAPVVLELSSWMLQGFRDIKKSPVISVVTNIMRDHMNMYSSFDQYIDDKFVIAKYQKPNDVLILNYEDKLAQKNYKKFKSTIYWVSNKKLPNNKTGLYSLKGWSWFVSSGKSIKILPIKSLKLVGQHNLYNVMSAVCLALISGVDLKSIRKIASEFKGVEYRLEVVKKIKGVTYINDTTATSPDATIAALKSMPKKPILIFGGTDKVLDFKPMMDEVVKSAHKLIFLPGTATEKMRKILGDRRGYFLVESMETAVKTAQGLAKNGDYILLSPGAASFGLFKNEFDRGSKFNKVVKGL